MIDETAFAVGSKVPVSPDIIDDIFDRTASKNHVVLYPWYRTVEFDKNGYMRFVYVAEVYV